MQKEDCSHKEDAIEFGAAERLYFLIAIAPEDCHDESHLANDAIGH